MTALRQRFTARVRAWSARRHRRDSLPLTVKRGRIYILPTRFGLTVAALLFAMLAAGLNYGNNLAIAFAFLLASLAIVAMHYCHRNLVGLRVDAQTESDGFAARDVRLTVNVGNESSLARYEIEVRCGSGRRLFRIAPGNEQAIGVLIETETRGVIEIGQWELHSRFPFGWFHAWTYIQAPLKIFVAPEPRGSRLLALSQAAAHDEIAARHEARGDEEFAGLRPYRPGDALKTMAWKVLARGREPAVQSFTQFIAAPEWLEWSALAGMPDEQRLSQLCRWVLDAEAASRPFGLRLPALSIGPDLGDMHERACLRALASFSAQAPE